MPCFWPGGAAIDPWFRPAPARPRTPPSPTWPSPPPPARSRSALSPAPNGWPSTTGCCGLKKCLDLTQTSGPWICRSFARIERLSGQFAGLHLDAFRSSPHVSPRPFLIGCRGLWYWLGFLEFLEDAVELLLHLSQSTLDLAGFSVSRISCCVGVILTGNVLVAVLRQRGAACARVGER